MYLIFNQDGSFVMACNDIPSSHTDDVYTALKTEEFDPNYSYTMVDGEIVKGSLISVDENEVTRLNAEFADTQYSRDRAAEYPSFGEQLDYIYHNGVDAWKTNIIQPIKNKYPKPSN
jgi:hypothetical protein